VLDAEQMRAELQDTIGALVGCAESTDQIHALLTEARCLCDSEPLVESVKRLIGERDSERRRAARLELKNQTGETYTRFGQEQTARVAPVASPAPVAQPAQQPLQGQRIRILTVGPANGSSLKPGDIITVMEQVTPTPDRGELTWVQDKADPWGCFGWCTWEPVAMKSDWQEEYDRGAPVASKNPASVAGQSTASLTAKIRRQRRELRHVNRRLREALLELEVLKVRGVVEAAAVPYVMDPNAMNWPLPDDS
jgi:hypothetical protein